MYHQPNAQKKIGLINAAVVLLSIMWCDACLLRCMRSSVGSKSSVNKNDIECSSIGLKSPVNNKDIKGSSNGLESSVDQEDLEEWYHRNVSEYAEAKFAEDLGPNAETVQDRFMRQTRRIPPFDLPEGITWNEASPFSSEYRSNSAIGLLHAAYGKDHVSLKELTTWFDEAVEDVKQKWMQVHDDGRNTIEAKTASAEFILVLARVSGIGIPKGHDYPKSVFPFQMVIASREEAFKHLEPFFEPHRELWQFWKAMKLCCHF